MVLVVPPCTFACLHVWTRGLGCFAGGVGVGWLSPARLGVCLPVGARGGCLWASSWGGGVRGVLWARVVGFGVPLTWRVCGSRSASARVYVRSTGGLGMWRACPSWSSCSASSAVTTRPMMGGHCRAYFPPAHAARSWAASWGADTGRVMCLLSGLV